MTALTGSLGGYAHAIHKRDGFKCQYCEMDGTKSFAAWLNLSWDHLLPKGHVNRDKSEYIVTACMFCNTADNWYFRNAEKRGISFDNKTPKELVAQRLHYVQQTRQNYEVFWQEHVRNTGTENDKG